MESKQYAVYFTDGGEVALELPPTKQQWDVRWLDVGRCQWRQELQITPSDRLKLTAPGQGHWVALVIVAD